ncbi:MAG TPA: hypothetical protein VMU39_22465 [Solirubrobacteraceae bacterium]|nr:hypothetical protein [Solirubrobacteraceae bacterium]
MSEDRPSDVLGGLPRTRPHRRSQKRAAQPTPATTPAPPDSATVTPGPALSPDTAATPDTTPPAAAPTTPAAAAKPRTARPRKPKTDAARRQPTPRGTPKARPEPTPTGAPKLRHERLRQPAQPEGTPATPRRAIRPAPASGADLVGTAVKAAAELAEIGLSISARAIRGAISRLPRP